MTGDPSRASALVPGYRLDRYELLCPIAEGGMASVWVARLRAKHGFKKLVAIKSILPKLAEDVKFQQMFLDEARIASKIDHVHVAHVLDLGDEHGVLYLVMEWVDGDSLSKLQRAVKASNVEMPLGVSLRIVADVCAGLHAAHELRDDDGHSLGVVHRDVSPQNILIGPGGVVKVIDFGIAKARDRVVGETSSGSLKGKIQFMAPEQAVGKAIDRRADVWSTGCVLYNLLCGEPPYDEKNQYATLHRIASGERPAPLPSRVPREVAEIVDKALSFEPNDRFATMAEMQAALESAMTELGMITSSRDIAELATIHLAGRVTARRKSLDLALRAATERDRVQSVLAAPLDDSSPSPREMLATVPDREREGMTPASVGTLDPSSMSSMPAAAPRRRRTRIVVGLAAVSAAIVLFALGRLTTTPPATHASGAGVAAVADAGVPAIAALPSAAAAPTETAPTSATAASDSAASAPAAPPSNSSASLRHFAPRPHPIQSSAPAAPPKKRPVDDGF